MIQLPRTFCVSLKETPKRKAAAQEYFNSLGLKFEFFDGVYGKNFGLKATSPNLLEFNNETYVTSGNIGCCLSHFLLWNICSYFPEEEFLIIEDDATFCDDFFNKFEKCYKQIPSDWKFVSVGWIPYGNDAECQKISENIAVKTPSGTQAYLVKKSILPYLIDSLSPVHYPIDLTLINRVFPNIKHYVFDPSLVSQRSYLNWTDPTWMSLVYDWETDHYKVGSIINRSISFGDGWHMIESLGKNLWRWSKPKFSFKLREKLVFDRIGLEFSSVKKNIVEFSDDSGNKQKYYISPGNNSIEIILNKTISLNGEVGEKFIPKETVDGSNDDRELGICLKGIYIPMNNEKISIAISKIL